MIGLLPGNATALERMATEALAQIQRTPIPLRQLCNPNTCPVALLPYLAWTFSVDRWDSLWPEHAKRAAIRAAHFVHSHKGTIGALRRVVEPLGYLIEIREWWEESPPGTPGTFKLDVGVLEAGITEEMHQELAWLIDDAKPLSRHLKSLNITLEAKLCAGVFIAVFDGDEIDVYPWSNPDIDLEIGGYTGLAFYTLDELDIHLHG